MTDPEEKVVATIRIGFVLLLLFLLLEIRVVLVVCVVLRRATNGRWKLLLVADRHTKLEPYITNIGHDKFGLSIHS